VGRTTAPANYPVVALTVMVAVAAALTLVSGWIYRGRDAI
jgi:ABC-2 type transport system permease protein